VRADNNMGGERVRLYVSGQFLGFKRSKVNQYNHTALVKLQGVESKTLKKGSHYRVIFGKVTRAHGSTGVVRSKFRKPLPSNAIGARIRCLLYPSTI
jgi:large subunit ribosomal protein L35Ae